VWLLFDAVIWFVAVYGATWLRFDFEDTPVLVDATLTFALTAVVAHLLIGSLIGPYAVGHRRGSFEETTDLAVTVLATATALLNLVLVADRVTVPHSVPAVAGAFALAGMFAMRFLVRSWRSRHATTDKEVGTGRGWTTHTQVAMTSGSLRVSVSGPKEARAVRLELVSNSSPGTARGRIRSAKHGRSGAEEHLRTEHRIAVVDAADADLGEHRVEQVGPVAW